MVLNSTGIPMTHFFGMWKKRSEDVCFKSSSTANIQLYSFCCSKTCFFSAISIIISLLAEDIMRALVLISKCEPRKIEKHESTTFQCRRHWWDTPPTNRVLEKSAGRTRTKHRNCVAFQIGHKILRRSFDYYFKTFNEELRHAKYIKVYVR